MPSKPKNRGGDDSDEDNEYYKRPTLAERVGPEEARRMLMDDDDDEGDDGDYSRSVKKTEEDDDKSMKSEQSAAGQMIRCQWMSHHMKNHPMDPVIRSMNLAIVWIRHFLRTNRNHPVSHHHQLTANQVKPIHSANQRHLFHPKLPHRHKSRQPESEIVERNP